MKENQIRKIAQQKGMRNEELFIKFISERLTNETHESYVEEWADRFLSGNPTSYMDNKSFDIYIKLLKATR